MTPQLVMFESLEVVLRPRRKGNKTRWSAHVKQGGVYGTNLVPNCKHLGIESIKKIVTYLLQPIAKSVTFTEESNGSTPVLAEASHHSAQQA